YKTGTEVIQMLVDIVSKNGNLLINVVQTPEGDLEPDVLAILDEIADWIPENGEGIYGSRPWKIYGENPAGTVVGKRKRFDENYKYDARNIRFTTKGETLYAFCMDIPQEDITINSLGKRSELNNKTIASVKMLGSKEKLVWNQNDDALVITKPMNLPEWRVVSFKVEFKKQS
ncbi:alpha-L-fucosidase, partial [Bacteroidota bacterium]